LLGIHTIQSICLKEFFMRTTAKILAAAALAVISVSSFAAPVSWTGTLTNVKIQYIPGGPNVILTGTGATCKWLASAGAMTLTVDSTAATTEATLNAAYASLLQAKAAGTAVTLTYDNSSTVCPIQNITR
jgi:hypothetical protein